VGGGGGRLGLTGRIRKKKGTPCKMGGTRWRGGQAMSGGKAANQICRRMRSIRENLCLMGFGKREPERENKLLRGRQVGKMAPDGGGWGEEYMSRTSGK